MSLCQPSVVGPLSELNTSVRVQGQLHGATVTIFSLKPSLHKMATGIASTSDEYFPLIVGVKLSAQDLLVAVQELGGQQSLLPSGDLGIGVQPKPKKAGDIGTVDFETHLYGCGRYVWVSGAVPGAKVEVLVNGQVLGGGMAYGGYARFSLSGGLSSATPVFARQVVPQLPPGPDIKRLPDPLPTPIGQGLPHPLIQLPIRGCDAAVKVTNVIDGALVTIKRLSGSIEKAGFDRSVLWFRLKTPLTEGDGVQIKQDVDVSCERLSGYLRPLGVGPLKPLNPPIVEAPLCAGTTRVRVKDLRPGALVHIAANGEIFDGQIPADRTWFDFTVPPLEGKSTVSATQEVCQVVSDPSPLIDVNPQAGVVGPAAIVGPLFACARSVSINKVHPGATIQIFAKNANGTAVISDLVNLYETKGTVPVAPHLHEGDDVYVVQWACSEKGAASKSEPVKPHPAVVPPQMVTPIMNGDVMVQVKSAIPGALVEIYVGNQFAGSAVATTLSGVTAVHSSIPLKMGDAVFAQQVMCGEVSKPGRPVTVVVAARFGPRPFYIIGHNTNTIDEVKAALDAGANAVEPDVNVYEDHSNELCISHGEGASGAPTLVQFLKDLHEVALKRPELSLVLFDCKPAAAMPQHGLEILSAIRTHLTFDTEVNVILSVAGFADHAMFNKIPSNLGPREGVMIDEEDDPYAVSDFLGEYDHQCFGNGIAVGNHILGPNVRPSVEHACKLRAENNRLKFIYSWSVNNDEDSREYIRIGLDGLITDEIEDLRNIVNESQFQSVVRMAQRSDNPFIPANFSYGLTIHTADKWMAGTDAKVTFTLTGTKGSSSVTLDAGYPYRLESDSWNYVTLQSPDLGDLISITVQRDSGGNAPDWFPERITVGSFRYGVLKQADFNFWIDSTSPFTRPLL